MLLDTWHPENIPVLKLTSRVWGAGPQLNLALQGFLHSWDFIYFLLRAPVFKRYCSTKGVLYIIYRGFSTLSLYLNACNSASAKIKSLLTQNTYKCQADSQIRFMWTFMCSWEMHVPAFTVAAEMLLVDTIFCLTYKISWMWMLERELWFWIFSQSACWASLKASEPLPDQHL